MSLGQTMLTAAFLVLLIALVINANRMIIDSSQTSYESEAITAATDLALDLIDEAIRKKYDTYAVNDPNNYQAVTAFTASSSLGPEGAETFALPDTSTPFKSHAKYDDFDDYNGYSRIASTGSISGFDLSATVYYVTNTDPDTKTTSKTYFKRIDVTVTHSQYLPKPIQFSRIVTY